MSDISPILEAYPDLEVLKLYGCFDCKSYFKPFQHKCLKTLIVNTVVMATDLSCEPLAQICELDLPALEYLELWGGRYSGRAINNLKPLLTGQSFPSLCCLGLPSFENTDELVEIIAESPILNRLAVLDLSLGYLSDKGAEILLNCPAINQLHTLNVAENSLSTDMIQRLSQLNCQVIIAQPQDDENHCYYALHE